VETAVTPGVPTAATHQGHRGDEQLAARGEARGDSPGDALLAEVAAEEERRGGVASDALGDRAGERELHAGDLADGAVSGELAVELRVRVERLGAVVGAARCLAAAGAVSGRRGEAVALPSPQLDEGPRGGGVVWGDIEPCRDVAGERSLGGGGIFVEEREGDAEGARGDAARVADRLEAGREGALRLERGCLEHVEGGEGGGAGVAPVLEEGVAYRAERGGFIAGVVASDQPEECPIETFVEVRARGRRCGAVVDAPQEA
jgi:hypothetical protein